MSGCRLGRGIDNQQIEEGVIKFLSDNQVTALFTTASFLDIQYGPHISSPKNHVMKRILNDYADKHKCSNVMVIAAEKINSDVTEQKIGGKCILIFDSTQTSNICNDMEMNKEMFS